MLLRIRRFCVCAVAVAGAMSVAPTPLAAQQPLATDRTLADKPRADSTASGDAARFDAVGYAAIADGAELGGITASHAMLPANSFVEITSLETGHTALVLVARQEAAPAGYILRLSSAAARLIGATSTTFAVRVRRVNPPGSDQQALREGKPASPRLDAPPILLTGLRRALPAAPATRAISPVAASAPSPATAPPARATGPAQGAARATLAKTTDRPKAPGASFPEPSAAKPAGPVPATARPAPVATTATTAPPPASGSYFVQIAALSSAERASALARSVGGQSQAVGALYRVRLGPFSTAQSAQQARDAIAKRGYGSARVTR